MANVQEFLDQYFGGLKTREATRQFNVEQAFNQTKLSNEMQEHQDLMQQKASEITNTQHYQNAMLNISVQKEAREHSNEVQDNLRDFYKSGFTQPAPTTQPLPYDTGGGQAPAQNLSFLDVGTPPVGPSQAQMLGGQDPSQALIQGLPMRAAPSIPMQGELTPDAQRPDPEMAKRITAPEGIPAGEEAYQQTDYAKSLATIKAKQADWMNTPVDMQKQYGLGPKIDVKDFISLTEAKINDLRDRAKDSNDNDFKMRMATMADETKRLQIATLAQSKVGATPEQISANHEGVMNNPDTFHELSSKEKTLERVELQKEGLPAPAKLNPTQADQETYAHRAITSLNNINRLLNDPQMLAIIQKRSGAVMGKVGNLEQDIGATAGLSDDEARKVQDFRSSMNYLVFTEGKFLFGSRIPIQLMDQLKSTSPKVAESIAMLRGSMDAVRRNAENTLISDEITRFGGKMRPDFYERNNIKGRNGTKEVEVQGFPYTAKLQDGVPQVFSNKTNDRTIVKRGSKIYEVVDK